MLVVGAAVLLARSAAALGRPAARYPDSIGYETFTLLGVSDRPWPVTMMFALFESDGARITVHVVLGTLAWMWLARELSGLTRWSRTAVLVTAAVSLSPQIIRYDVAMLSESLTVSYAVAAVAATVRLCTRPSTASRVVWMVALALCAFSRPTHLLLVGACLVPHVIGFVRSRGRSLQWTGAALAVLLGVGLVQLNNASHMSLLNLYTVVSGRVLTDDRRFEWFVDRGMPEVPGMRNATGYDYAGDLPADVSEIVRLPEGQQPPSLMRAGGVEVATWLEENGWRTLVWYLATHPKDTLVHARDLLDGTLSPANGDFLPLDNGPMFPWSVFGPWQASAAVIAAAVALSRLRGRPRRLTMAIVAMTTVLAVVQLATVHTSGIEHVRHSVTNAAVLRALAVAALVHAFLPRRVIEEDDGPGDAPAR